VSYVSAQCSHCNGTIKLDDSMDTGHCIYCGTKMIVKKAIELHRVTIDRSKDIENMLYRATQCYEDGFIKEAEKFYNKVIDLDATNHAAWWGKYIIASEKTGKKCIMINGHVYDVADLTHQNRKIIKGKTGIDIIYILNTPGALNLLSIPCWEDQYVERALQYADKEGRARYEKVLHEKCADYEDLKARNDLSVKEFIAKKINEHDMHAAELLSKHKAKNSKQIVKNVVIAIVIIFIFFWFIALFRDLPF